MSLLSQNKRIKFREEISQRNRRQIINQRRSQLNQSIQSKILKKIMHDVEEYHNNKHNGKHAAQSISQDNLMEILQLIEQREQDALIYLGNLLIDDIVNQHHFPVLCSFLRPNQQDKNYEWLVYILCEKQFEFNEQIYQNLLFYLGYYKKNIETFRKNQTVERKVMFTLKILASSLNKSNFSETLLNSIFANPCGHISVIVDLTQNHDDVIKKEAISTLRRIFAYNSWTSQMAYKAVSEGCWSEFFQNIFLSIYPKERIAGIQIANNMMCGRIESEQLPKKIMVELLDRCIKQKKTVKIEISYYFFNYLESRSLSDNFTFNQLNLICECLEDFFESDCEELLKNGRDICRLLANSTLIEKYPYLEDLMEAKSFWKHQELQIENVYKIDIE